MDIVTITEAADKLLAPTVVAPNNGLLSWADHLDIVQLAVAAAIGYFVWTFKSYKDDLTNTFKDLNSAIKDMRKQTEEEVDCLHTRITQLGSEFYELKGEHKARHRNERVEDKK